MLCNTLHDETFSLQRHS